MVFTKVINPHEASTLVMRYFVVVLQTGLLINGFILADFLLNMATCTTATIPCPVNEHV